MSGAMTWRRRLYLVLAAAAAVAAGWLASDANAAVPATTTPPPIALTLSVKDAPDAPARTATLVCVGTSAGATGYLADAPADACRHARRVARTLATTPDPHRFCTEIYGGPQTAAVRGLVGDAYVRRSFARRNGCEIGEWNGLGILLSGAISPARRLVDYHRQGGLLGFDDRLTVSRSGLAIHTPRSGVARGFRLSVAELAELGAALDAADFPSLASEYLPPFPVADGFTYTIAHRGTTVVTADGAVPAALEPPIAVLNRLLTRAPAARHT